MIERIRRAARAHIGTGKLNRALRAAFAANPPPMVKGKRLKLFYATQSSENESARVRAAGDRALCQFPSTSTTAICPFP
jgi:predicted GTPase